jgi:hypothetical protein
MDDLTPEQLQQLIELGVIPDEQQMLMKQMQSAQQLRDTPIPKGGMAGRVYVADPLGAVAAGVDRYQGHKQMQGLDQKYGATLDKQTAARSKYAQMIQQLRQPTQPVDPMGNAG